jgi:hypothetical protein
MENTIKKNREKLDIYKNQYISLLDEYKKMYVTTKTYPSVQEYSTSFSQTTDWLNQLSSQLFTLMNAIEIETKKIQDQIESLNVEITVDKSENESLLQKYQQIVSSHNGSSELIDDSKFLYNYQYTSNFDVFLGIVMMGLFYIFIFSWSVWKVVAAIFFVILILYLIIPKYFKEFTQQYYIV